MQATLTHHSPTRKSLDLTFPASVVDKAFGDVLARLAPKIKVPGFRAGKVPKTVLLSRYEREIQSEVTEQLMKQHFMSAAANAGAHPVSQPAVEAFDLNEGRDGTIRALFDVAPDVTLPDYKNMKLVKRKRLVDDAAVEEHLEGLRQQAARWQPVEDCGAEEGHHVVVDVKLKPQGMKVMEHKDQEAELLASRAFDKELLGLRPGERREFTITIPEDVADRAVAGKPVHYEVLLKDLRTRVIPELNDEFAKDMGDFADLAVLKVKLRQDIEEASEQDATMRLHNAALDLLLESTSFEAPASMVALQLDDYCHEFATYVGRQGIDARKINWEAYRQSRKSEAERAVRTGYLLQSIGNVEDIQVSDEEIDQEIRDFMATRKIQQPFEAFKAALQQRNATLEIKGRLRTDKILDKILASAQVTEEILDKEAFQKLLEIEHKRDTGAPQARFDAGGVAGGELEDQDGGAPDAVKQADAVDAAQDEEAAPKAKKATKKSEAAKTDDAPQATAPETKPKKAAKKTEDSTEKPKKTAKS